MALRMFKAVQVAGGFENAGEEGQIEQLLAWIGAAANREGLVELRDAGRTTHFRVTRTMIAKDFGDDT